MVRVGGILLYVTCTLAKDENEHIATRFERSFCVSSQHATTGTCLKFEPAPLREAWGDEVASKILQGKKSNDSKGEFDDGFVEIVKIVAVVKWADTPKNWVISPLNEGFELIAK